VPCSSACACSALSHCHSASCTAFLLTVLLLKPVSGSTACESRASIYLPCLTFLHYLPSTPPLHLPHCTYLPTPPPPLRYRGSGIDRKLPHTRQKRRPRSPSLTHLDAPPLGLTAPISLAVTGHLTRDSTCPGRTPVALTRTGGGFHCQSCNGTTTWPDSRNRAWDHQCQLFGACRLSSGFIQHLATRTGEPTTTTVYRDSAVPTDNRSISTSWRIRVGMTGGGRNDVTDVTAVTRCRGRG